MFPSHILLSDWMASFPSRICGTTLLTGIPSIRLLPSETRYHQLRGENRTLIGATISSMTHPPKMVHPDHPLTRMFGVAPKDTVCSHASSCIKFVFTLTTKARNIAPPSAHTIVTTTSPPCGYRMSPCCPVRRELLSPIHRDDDDPGLRLYLPTLI